MNIAGIKEFIRIADVGSIKIAAQSLCLPAATLSSRLSSFEKSLGATLFVREKKSISLSEEGLRFYPEAKKILDCYNEIRVFIQNEAETSLDLKDNNKKSLHFSSEKLYEFLILSRVLSYTTAAEMLYISQPVLSKHIHELELVLGDKLFLRTTHTVQLTTSGQYLAKEGPRLLELCRHAEEVLLLPQLQSSVKIAAAFEFTYSKPLQDFLRRFSQKHPGVFLDLSIKTDGTNAAMLNQFDLVFTPCEYHMMPENVSSYYIGSHAIRLALPKGHPLLQKEKLSLSALAKETLFVPFMDEIFGPYAKNRMLARKCTADQIACVPMPNLSSALFQVSLHHGVALFPEHVACLLPQGVSSIIITDEDAIFHELLYYHPKTENRAAKLFLEEFIENITNFNLLSEDQSPSEYRNK